MSTHARTMDAAGYWRQFVYPVYFDKAGDSIAGTIRRLIDPPRGAKDAVPAFEIQTKDGRAFVVTAQQARLKAELGKLAPGVGDQIRITYNGEAERAAPGFNPAKEFTIELRRAGSPPPSGPENTGEVPENGSEAGK